LLLSFLLAAVTVLASGFNSTGTAPSPAPQFTANLLPSNETPPVTNGESTASGTVTVAFNTTTQSGSIVLATANFQLTLTGFPATAAVTGAQIRIGAVGVAGAIAVDTTIGPNQFVLTGGAGSFGTQNVPVPGATIQAIIANPSGYYFEVRTVANPNGVMRGQLTAIPG